MAIYGTVFGRVTQDATTFNWGDGRVGVRVGLVSENSRAWRDEDPKPTWVQATIFRGGEKIAPKLTKGTLVVMHGEIVHENREYNMDITVDDFRIIPRQNDSGYNQGYQNHGGYNSPNESFNGGVDDTPSMNVSDDDMPF